MAFAHTLRLVLAALFIAGAKLPARALQLGETKAQILARHGAPGAEDRGKDVVMYYWGGWSAQLEFKEDSLQKLIYRRELYLQESEVIALLQSNGGAARWRETTPDSEQTRRWVRDDGAVANCLAVRPLMMTFQGGRGPMAAPATPATPKIVVPATPPVVSSTPPSFPKLLGSEPEPESRPSPASPPALAPLSGLRPLPKLQAEEVATAPDSLNGRSTSEPESPQPPGAAAGPAAVEKEPASEEAMALPENESTKSGHGFVIGLVAILAAAIGGGIYLFKTKAGRGAVGKVQVRATAPRRETAEPVPVATPALDALRSDQFELLVGEIFRREGYAVELSAAAAQGDSIDLTLRRDAETILVQCKHWKASHVSEREVREFYGAMMANGAPRGIFVTAGSFTRDAHEFAEGKGIDLMDRAALEESTAAVTRPGENFCEIKEWVGEFTAHARVFDPECPICQGTMVIRHNRANGAASWSCRNHPRCPGRREPRLDLLVAA